jgi:hypothetical protein
MKLPVKLVLVLLSTLLFTACGNEDAANSDTVNHSAVTNDVTDTTSVDDDTNNRAPVISGTPATSVDEGVAYSFKPEASDADGDTLSFRIANRPNWATFDTSTGQLSGTPDSNSAGTYSNLIISVSDGQSSVELPAFDIVVVNQGSLTVLEETASRLRSAEVSGANIVLAWTHDDMIPEGGYDVLVDGVDTNDRYRTTEFTATIAGLDLEVSHCFSIQSRYVASDNFPTSNQVCTEAQVSENQAPSISGTPEASVEVGATYSFTPSADDPDNDGLVFRVNNLPTWASFNDETGAITGQPQESDVGIYTDITVSVSDGALTTSISPFDIEVWSIQLETSSLTLNWTAPSARTDGTVLEISEIEGYHIYVGETAETLELDTDLNDGQADSFILEDLPVGTYFVAMSVYDVDGNESALSNVLELTTEP